MAGKILYDSDSADSLFPCMEQVGTAGLLEPGSNLVLLVYLTIFCALLDPNIV